MNYYIIELKRKDHYTRMRLTRQLENLEAAKAEAALWDTKGEWELKGIAEFVWWPEKGID